MRRAIRFVALICLASISTFAQAPAPVDRLPKDAVFFFSWNGMSSLQKARATNGLLRLWDDPEFAAVRQLLMERAGRGSKPEQRASKEEMDLLLNAASNPFILGFANLPGGKKTAPNPGKAAPTGLFFIYDQTGKTEIIEKIIRENAKTRSAAPAVTTLTFSGVTITREETERAISFSAKTGNYVLYADSREVMETLIQQFTANEPASVVSTAAYQAAAAQRSPDAFCEFFFRMPDLTQLHVPTTQGVNLSAMVKGLHLERLQAMAASASLAGNGMRIRLTAIGDTSPGSIFDLVGSSNGEFYTLPLAPSGASINATRFDFHAFYKTLRGAVQSGLNTEQATQLEMLEGMAGMQLGVGIAEALQLFTGEFAAISLNAENDGASNSNSAFDLQRNLYAFSIERPDDVVKIIQTTAARNLASESREGDATILSITMPYVDEKTGAQRKRFYYVGVTPHLLIVAPRKALLKEAILRSAAPGGLAAGGLAADPAFQQIRKRLPNALSSLSYSDLNRFPWQTIVDAMIQEGNKKESEKFSAQEEQALRALPKIFLRYLHVSFGGAWKERNGIFVDSYIE